MLTDQRMLNHWARLVNAKDKQLKKILYQITCSLCRKDELVSNGTHHIKQLLNSCEGYNHWLDQTVPVRSFFKDKVKGATLRNYEELWKDDVHTNPKCYNYRIYKKCNRRKFSYKITNTFKDQFDALQSCQS